MAEQWGKYHLSRRIARGGMAEVFKADKVGLAGFVKPVCLKRIRPEFSDDPEFVAMFKREARIAATLHHPNIVQVFDFDSHDGQLFLAMEFVDGLDLQDTLVATARIGLRLPLEFVMRVMHGLLAALSHAHQQQMGNALQPVVHRDVSPHNLLISTGGNVKLTDFGIAKVRGLSQATRAGMIKGKLAYLSPEQARGEEIDHRSDLFSAGLLLYEMLLGRRLFRGKSEAEIISQVLKVGPPEMKGISRPLTVITQKLLAWDPQDRYQSAQTTLEALQRTELEACSERTASELVCQLISLGLHDASATGDRLKAPVAGRDEPEVADAVADPPVAVPASNDRPKTLIYHEKSDSDDLDRVEEHQAPPLGQMRQSDNIPLPEVTEPRSAIRPAWLWAGAFFVLAVALGLWMLIGRGESHDTAALATSLNNDTKDFEDTIAAPAPDTQPSVVHLADPLSQGEVDTRDQTASLAVSEDDMQGDPTFPPQPSGAGSKGSTGSTGMGSIQINVRPWARIQINGLDKGSTPLKKIQLKAGIHRITLINDELGYRKSISVRIRSGKVSTINEIISMTGGGEPKK
ncbi:MAG: serine/threonine-protein kinase [Myxococcota bacterium]|nr:serine/threonine-protein kinase [Myxococcota bacterium]